MKCKCPECKRTSEFDDEKIVVFCPCCLIEMKEMNDDRGR